MITWYKDKDLAVYFSTPPSVKMRYPLSSMTNIEKKSIEKYPFENKKFLEVILEDYRKNKKYSFSILENYCWDGASIPRPFWKLIGTKSEPAFLIPSLIHDVLCENHHFVENDRYFSSCVFNALLKTSGVNKCKRFLMKNSVDMYQRFCKW